jgi:hypothetical protein
MAVESHATGGIMVKTAEDRLAILDLLSRYNWAIDGRLEDAAAAWADLFVDTGCFRVRADPTIGVGAGAGPVDDGACRILTEVRGRSALRAYAERVQAVRPRAGFHHVDNVLVDGDAERARITCYLRSVLAAADGASEEVRGNGYYRDELRKVDGEWRFESRELFVPDV